MLSPERSNAELRKRIVLFYKTPRLEKPLLFKKLHNSSALSGRGDARKFFFIPYT
jgi:hypothetical protein